MLRVLASAITILPWARRLGGVPDMTSDYNSGRGLLAHEGGSFVGQPGGLSSKSEGGSNTPVVTGSNGKKYIYNKTPAKLAKFIDTVFRGGKPPANINLLVTIVSSRASSEYAWEGFVMNRTLFLKGNGVDTVDLRQSLTAVSELAEECLKCRSLVVCLEKDAPQLVTLIRTFMYIGFETCSPGVFNHDIEKFWLVGMEL